MALVVILIVMLLCTPLGAWVWSAGWVCACAYGLAVAVFGILEDPWPFLRAAAALVVGVTALHVSERRQQHVRGRWW